MRLRQSEPGGLATDPAPDVCYQGESYPPTRPPQGIDDLAEVFAGRILEAERSTLCAGWRDPAGLNEAACDAGLRGEHFVDARHSFQLAYLCTCAELDRWPTVDEALSLAGGCNDVYLDADDLDDVLWRTDALPSMLAMLAETVVENSRDFTRARQGLREAVSVLIGTVAYDFDIIIRPRARGRERRR